MSSFVKFKDIHKGQDIYILASGKSVDFLPKSFLHNKLVIGINQSYKFYPTQYLVRKECAHIEKVLQECPDAIHFISKGNCGSLNHANIHTLVKHNFYGKKQSIVVYNHLQNIHRVQSLPPDDHLIVSHSTITTGIHLAAYMGASNIILIGHDCGTIDHEPNFDGYHTNDTYKICHRNGKEDYIAWLSQIEQDTLNLKRLIQQKYKANIVSINPFINLWREGHTLQRK